MKGYYLASDSAMNGKDMFLDFDEFKYTDQNPSNDLATLFRYDESSNVFEPSARSFHKYINLGAWSDLDLPSDFKRINEIAKSSAPDKHIDMMVTLARSNGFPNTGRQLTGLKLAGSMFEGLSQNPDSVITSFKKHSMPVPTGSIEPLFDLYTKQRSDLLDALSDLKVPSTSLGIERDGSIYPFHDAYELGGARSISNFITQANTYNTNQLQNLVDHGNVPGAEKFAKQLSSRDVSNNFSLAFLVTATARLTQDENLLELGKVGLQSASFNEFINTDRGLSHQQVGKISEAFGAASAHFADYAASNLIGNEYAPEYRDVAKDVTQDIVYNNDARKQLTELHRSLYSAQDSILSESMKAIANKAKTLTPNPELKFPSEEFKQSFDDLKERAEYVLDNYSVDPDMKHERTRTQTMSFGR